MQIPTNISSQYNQTFPGQVNLNRAAEKRILSTSTLEGEAKEPLLNETLTIVLVVNSTDESVLTSRQFDWRLSSYGER